MSEQADDAGLASFQDEVLKEIKSLNTMVEMSAGFRRTASKATEAEKPSGNQFMDSLGHNISLRLGQAAVSALKTNKKIDERTREVRAFLKEDETRRMLCTRLRVVENSLSQLAVRDIEHDAAEIASAITPLLYLAVQAKTIVLERDPVSFALSAWMIARTGIKTYCGGFQDEADPLSL